MILKQTFKNHIIPLEFTITVTLLLLCGWWYFDFDRDYPIVVGLFHGALTIPSLFLHIEYWYINKDEEIEIDPDEIVVRKNGVERSYKNTDIAKIIIYKSASLDRWGIPLTAMEYYHYVRLITKTGEELIITRLMSPKIDTEIRKLSGVPCERKKRFFCTLGWR